MFDETRNRYCPTEISKFEVNYYIFDGIPFLSVFLINY